MLKRAMNNSKLKLYILFYILYIAQLTQCKVAQRRDDGGEANPKQANLVSSELSDDSDSSKDADDAASNVKNATPASTRGTRPDSDSDSSKDANEAASNVKNATPASTRGTGPDNDSDSSNDADDAASNVKNATPASTPVPGSDNDHQGKSCWVSFGEKTFYQKMNAVDDKYKAARKEYAKEVDIKHFDTRMLEALKQTRGVAERTLQKFRGNPNVIPAGLNLGSYSMMRMPGSMLFFYRMKLRNDTRFVVNFIHNDVDQLTLTMRLSLNDLHLIGQYERAITSKEDPSRLYYRPNKGEVEFLLKDVKYKVEGRYRLLEDRLHIEHIISEIPPMEILMRYAHDTKGGGTPLLYEVLKEYMDRMQNDLDLWLKDYFNDFLMIYGFEEAKKNQQIQNYENERTYILNEYADKVIDILNDRLGKLGSQFLMPDFVLTAANGMEIKLYDGTVRGLDSMYRRSVATGKREFEVRYLDADIGFSGLKAEYRYDTYVKTGMPPVSGVFILNADDIYAHIALQVTDPKTASTVDVQVEYKRNGKPESLTIEGPANRIVANFNHLLEHHIITIMSSMLVYNIKSISTLTNCDPANLPDNKDDDDPTPSDDDNDGPTRAPDDDDDGPKPAPDEDDDGPKPAPDDDDDGPTSAPDDDDDGPKPAPDDDNDGPTRAPDDDYDGPKPAPDDDDDGPKPAPDDDDDGPLPAPDDDDDGPTQVPDDDDDSSKPAPDDDDDGPKPAPDDDDDGPKPAPNYDDNGPKPAPDDDDDGPKPAPDDDDDGPKPTPDDDDDGPTPAPDDDDDGPTPPDNEDNKEPNDQPDEPYQSDDGNKLKPEFGFARKESIELELPPGSPIGGTYKIDHNDTFTMTRLNENGERLTSGDDPQSIKRSRIGIIKPGPLTDESKKK